MPKLKPSRARFSLRLLLFAVFTFALYFAFLHRLETQRQATIEMIRRYGGSVHESDSVRFALFPGQRVTSVFLSTEALQNITKPELEAFPNVKNVLVGMNGRLDAYSVDNIDLEGLRARSLYNARFAAEMQQLQVQAGIGQPQLENFLETHQGRGNTIGVSVDIERGMQADKWERQQNVFE